MNKNTGKNKTSQPINDVKQIQPLLLKRQIIMYGFKHKPFDTLYQISFETDFFKQHWNSFLKGHRVCFLKINLQGLCWTQIKQKIQDAHSTQRHLKVLRLVQEKPTFSEFQKPIFQQITRQKERLLTFYSLIEANFGEQQSIELIYIGYCMCKKYQQIKCNLMLLQSQNYCSWAKSTAQGYANSLEQQYKKITFLQSESVNSIVLAKFVAIYCQTVLLIIQEYFDNPNAGEEDELV